MLLDLRQATPLLDYFVIATVTNTRQGQALGTWEERARHAGELIQGGTQAG